VEISEGVLYRAQISIPARVPIGTYTAETFLIRDGRVIAGAAHGSDQKLGFRLRRRRRRALVVPWCCRGRGFLLLGWGAAPPSAASG
jgi:hypothetical protein